MTRSPLFYPLNRGGDSEVGGAADLQTDVMRFMAILSLCLVAIFALVQSMPLAPAPDTNVPTESPTVFAEKMPQQNANVAVQLPPATIELSRPQPDHLPTESTFALQRPTLTKSSSANDETVVEPPASSNSTDSNVEENVEEGFSLRFETDAALIRLVAQQVVGFYAMTENETFRMSIDNSDVSFWTASTPARFHEMELATVPNEVVRAFSRISQTPGVKWGVTLTPGMSETLTHYLNTEKGGALVIAGNGHIDLRHRYAE